MTDLPQLQTLLVDAAVKRRRRRRVRRAAVPVLVAAMAVLTVPWVLRDAFVPDREVPITPAPAPSAQEAFAVLRDATPPRWGDGQPGDVLGELGRSQPPRPLLLVRGDQLCLVIADRERYACGRAADYTSGHKILSMVVDDWAYAVFPDGVKTVTRTWQGRGRARYAVLRNLATFKVPVGAGELDWRAPDGTTQREQLRDIRNPRLWFHRLGRPETALDREAGYRGARFLAGDADGRVKSWIVPRHDAICLVARAGGDQRSVCRSPVADTQRPLMLALPAQPQRILVFAFPSWQTPLGVSPERARRSIGHDAILVLDGDEAKSVRQRDEAGRETVVNVPSGTVLRPGDREVPPDALEP